MVTDPANRQPEPSGPVLFSVVLCTYNRSSLVGRAVRSVLSQRFEDMELIVVDDGSTDDTRSVLHSIDDPRLKVIRKPNEGPQRARNTGLDAAVGRYVVFLDDDDSVLPTWLTELAAAISPGTGMVSCTAEAVGPDQQHLKFVPARSHLLFADIRGTFLAGTFALDREVLAAVGGYAPELLASQQTEMLLRALPELRSRGLTHTLVDRPLVRITRGEASGRPLRQPERLLAGAEYLLEQHHGVLSANRRALANYHAIAGVSAAKVGRIGLARRHLRKAAAANPRSQRHLLRLAIAAVPGLPQRVWSRDAAHFSGTLGAVDLPGDVPVVLLGGNESAVSCARRFVRAGTTTVVVNHAAAPALRCRGVVAQPLGHAFGVADYVCWLNGPGKKWEGSVVIPLSDLALHAVMCEYSELSKAYRPAVLDPDVVEVVLDEQSVAREAAKTGVSTPRQLVGTGTLDTKDFASFEYPLVLQPRRSHELTQSSGTNNLRVASEVELVQLLPMLTDLPSGFVVKEAVSGGDEHLSSYYALRDASGTVHLEFTKRVERRCPPNEGEPTFHVLENLPETAELGRRFFEHIGLVGFGGVDFKQDSRTGVLKIVECNHLLPAATPLLQASGIDVAGAIYRQALGLDPVPVPSTVRSGTLWYPVGDLISFRISGEGLAGWLRRPWRSTMPYWDVRDPAPSVYLWSRALTRWTRGKWRKLGSGQRPSLTA